MRNDCLNALYNEPLSRVVWMLPARDLMYFRMRRGWGIRDPWGWAWIAGPLAGPLVPPPPMASTAIASEISGKPGDGPFIDATKYALSGVRMNGSVGSSGSANRLAATR